MTVITCMQCSSWQCLLYCELLKNPTQTCCDNFGKQTRWFRHWAPQRSSGSKFDCRLSFMPKPKVTERYFCIILKPGCATPIVIYDRTANEFIDFYWFAWNNPSQKRMATINLPLYSTYTQSFHFRSTVLPEIRLTKKHRSTLAKVFASLILTDDVLGRSHMWNETEIKLNQICFNSAGHQRRRFYFSFVSATRTCEIKRWNNHRIGVAWNNSETNLKHFEVVSVFYFSFLSRCASGLRRCTGDTENAGPENGGPKNIKGWKMHDCKWRTKCH